MIPPDQFTSLALAEQKARDAERRTRRDPGAYSADFSWRTGSRLGALRRMLMRRPTPAQRPSAA
jgi:hypothetical protein